MVRRFGSLFAAVAVLCLSAGCPQIPSDVQFGGAFGNDPRITDTPTARSPGGVAGDRSDNGGVDDSASDEFPNCRTTVNSASLAAEVLDLLNSERTSRGLSPLTHNTILEAQAAQYACEMIEYNFFAHDNPVTGSSLADRAAEFDYDYLTIGENLAAGQQSAIDVMRDWMSSPGHRANILNPEFTEIGIAVRVGGSYGIYWVQEFGRPLTPGLLVRSGDPR